MLTLPLLRFWKSLAQEIFKSNIELGYQIIVSAIKWALTRYGKLTWESAHAWNLIVLCLLIARYDFCINGAFEFSCIFIAKWRNVWYHYHTLGYQVISISKVIDISCNGRRNVLWNNYIIDKFVDTISCFVCIRIVGEHSFMTRYPNFQLYILYSVKFGIKLLTGCGLWQDTYTISK